MSLAKAAEELGKKSRKYAMAKEKEQWLALFADDAVIMDPVGKSAFDPEGNGHQGKAAITEFYDNIIGPSNIVMDEKTLIPAGDCSAVYVQVIHQLGEGKTYPMDMIIIYTAKNDNELASLKAYWDFDGLMEKFAG